MYECVPPRFRSTIALAASLFFLAPLAAQAALYLPGATLDPSCAPADSNCGVSSIVGIGTTNSIPYYAANGSILSATSTFQLLANGTASTTNLIVTNSLTLGSLTGFLKATAGAIATSLINLASDVTGILPIGNGGTGLSSITGNRLLYTNANGSALLEVATSSLNLTTASFLSPNISQWTNNAGYLTSLAGAASTTLLSDTNTWSGNNNFNNITLANLTTASFLSPNISQWTNNAGYLTSLAGAASTTLLSDTNTWSGNNNFNNITLANLTATGTLTSNVTTGTAPLAVNSTTKVANLNADLLDGFDSSAFGDATAANQTTILSRIGTNADATTTPSASASLWAGMKYIAGNMKTNVTAMSAEAYGYAHANAAIYCYGLSAAAAVAMDGDTSTVYTDWRLPTVGEADVFEGTITSANYIWTATVHTALDYWTRVRLSDGSWTNSHYSTVSSYVRCVR